jgi:iron(III) transport system substrate-binding protein
MRLVDCFNVLARRTPALLLGTASVLAHAQAPQGKNDAVYQYRGADRDATLLAKAREEGSVVLYTSLATLESMPVAKAFEKKYGIKVELWRAVSEKVVQKAATEAKAKRYAVDVIETNGPEMEMLTREKLFSEFYSPYLADMPAMAIPAHRQWVSDRTNFFVVAYNTNKVKREELPKEYTGFLDPKWRGRISLEATDTEWMATLVKRLGNDAGMSFFNKLSQMAPEMRKGHILLTELVAAGEVPVALTVYSSEVDSLKRRGGPIDWVPVQPVVARPQGIGVAKNAPHPHAALLFADFILSPEGQELFKSLGRIPTSNKVKTELSGFPYVAVDPATVLDESDKWNKVWDGLFLKR